MAETGNRDYSQPLQYNLATNKPNKTLDIGQNGTTVSTDPYGTVLQLGAYHPIHGIILAAPYEQFDKTRYYDPTYVREYRTRMLEMVRQGDRGFGIRVDKSDHNVAISHQTMDTAVVTFRTEHRAEVKYTLAVDEDGAFAQNVEVKNPTTSPITLEFGLNLDLSVHRASYGQLTEGGPVPLPDCENRLSKTGDGTGFTVINHLLDAHLTGRLFVDATPVSLVGLEETVSTGILSNANTSHSVTIQPKACVHIVAWFKLSPGVDPIPPPQQPPSIKAVSQGVEAIWKHANDARTWIIRRNVDYILGNCSFPISKEVVGMITDHVALPLGWNRDNYWQWRLLLIFQRNIDRLLTNVKREQYQKAISHTLKGHLRWAFQVAGRPHGFWHRSYIISGKPKDGPTFQLDQQCYPFLELCDYYQQYPGEADFVKGILLESTAVEVLDLLAAKKDEVTGLYPTDETPGDDAVDHPYHFSSHVLLWYTTSRMAQVLRDLGFSQGLNAAKLQMMADDVREATLQHFMKTDEASGELRLAYLSDGHGKTTFYHDANDIPTRFAVTWGFLHTSRDLEAWNNTMSFAVSEENKLGCSTGGPFTGLGSVHSKGPWPLGYFQEMLFAHKSEHTAALQDATRRIRGTMQWDGTFGEAVDAKTGITTSKAWFSWPGAMISAALIEEGIDI